MPELTDENVGNLMMLGGALLFAGYAFKDRLLTVWQGLSGGAKSPDTSIHPKDILSTLSVHDIVEVLIQDRKDENDDEGVMLIGTFGKHIYDFYIKEDEVKNE